MKDFPGERAPEQKCFWNKLSMFLTNLDFFFFFTVASPNFHSQMMQHNTNTDSLAHVSQVKAFSCFALNMFNIKWESPENKAGLHIP